MIIDGSGISHSRTRTHQSLGEACEARQAYCRRNGTLRGFAPLGRWGTCPYASTMINFQQNTRPLHV
jgi:hypothetical protein